MLDKLLCNQLEVVLIPAPERRHSNHYIRAVQYANPIWYQNFCKEHKSNCKKKRWQTRIRRQCTIQALERIIRGETKGIYVERLLGFTTRENQKFINLVAFETEVNYGKVESLQF